jgi:ABC-type Fe3+ transport system permease subunit
MDTTEKLVTIRASLEKPATTGTVKIVTWNAKERSRRALKTLGICWGIGLFCIIMPLVHFVLVPGMVIAGVVLFLRISGQESQVLGGEGVCPECKKTFRIAKAANRFPMDELCEHCRAGVSISI